MFPKYFRFISSIALTLSLSLFPFAQAQNSGALSLGFPSYFYTIHYSANSGYEVHCSVGALILNVAFFYILLTLIRNLYQKYVRT